MHLPSKVARWQNLIPSYPWVAFLCGGNTGARTRKPQKGKWDNAVLKVSKLCNLFVCTQFHDIMSRVGNGMLFVYILRVRLDAVLEHIAQSIHSPRLDFVSHAETSL